MKTIRYILFLAFALITPLILNSCHDDDPVTIKNQDTISPDSIFTSKNIVKTNQRIHDYMKEVYLWNTHLPSSPDYSLPDPMTFLESVIYKPIDRWSFIITKQEYLDYFVKAKFFGYGFSFTPDNVGKLRVAYVFRGSDLYSSGVKRGWIIKKINNTTADTTNIQTLLGPSEEGVTNTFTFEKPDGNEVSFTYAKKEISMNMVLLKDTIKIDNKIIGHLVFKGFLGSAKAELEEAFLWFKNVEINELIVDVRYNGGGDLEICNYLANLICGIKTNGQLFARLTYNDIIENSDEISSLKTKYYIKQDPNSVNISRCFFITSPQSASASESLINGLKPLIGVKSVGTTTHGKPTGMNVFPWEDLGFYFAPVTFKVTNKDGFGDFYNGLAPDQTADDDVTHDFSDRNEACLKQALYYIQNESFMSTTKSSKLPYDHKWKGVQWEIQAY